MSAALASVQMDRLAGFLKARVRNAKILTDRVASLDGVEFTQNSKDRTHIFYLYTLHLRKNRDRVQKELNSAGVGASVYWSIPVHKTPLYRKLGYARKALKMTEDAAGHVLSLPVYPGLSDEDLETVAREFRRAARAYL